MVSVRITLAVLFLIYAHVVSSYASDSVVISVVDGSADAHAGIAVLREAYKRIDYNVEIKPFSGKEALEQSNAGKVDAELQRIDGIGRGFSNLIQVPIPINYIQGAVFTKSVTFPVTGWYSLKPYRIGIVKGILFAKEGTKGMNVVVASSYEAAMRMLDKGEIDIAVMPRISALLEMKLQNYTDIKMLGGILETMFLYHYVHRKNAALVPKLEKELKQMILNGTTQQLRQDAYDRLLVNP
ncbi:MAG: transporter substrate-binding domain-containing protein [Nitrospina sp.]|jgi:polar amino acid transport system substrate-binding protein|nr:transporter substrate-binding domain-containing protein [Nitrospina sp.]